MTRPRCACCNKPLAYATHTIWFREEITDPTARGTMDFISGYSKTIRLPVDQLPKTKADAQKHTNLPIVSIKYNRPPDRPGDDDGDRIVSIPRLPRHVDCAHTWDGESYQGRGRIDGVPHPIFCGQQCMADFGLASYRAGSRMRHSNPKEKSA